MRLARYQSSARCKHSSQKTNIRSQQGRYDRRNMSVIYGLAVYCLKGCLEQYLLSLFHREGVPQHTCSSCPRIGLVALNTKLMSWLSMPEWARQRVRSLQASESHLRRSIEGGRVNATMASIFSCAPRILHIFLLLHCWSHASTAHKSLIVLS